MPKSTGAGFIRSRHGLPECNPIPSTVTSFLMVFCKNILKLSILDVKEKQRENKNMKLFKAFILVLNLANCSSPEVKPRGVGRIDPAAYAADNMTFDKPHRAHEPNEFNFYYKHCQVEERTPPPRGAIWECTEP